MYLGYDGFSPKTKGVFPAKILHSHLTAEILRHNPLLAFLIFVRLEGPGCCTDINSLDVILNTCHPLDFFKIRCNYV